MDWHSTLHESTSKNIFEMRLLVKKTTQLKLMSGVLDVFFMKCFAVKHRGIQNNSNNSNK